MYRKVLMVIMATLLSLAGRKIQAMLVFALMVIITALHNLVRPFMTVSLNNIEMLSIFALMCSIYAGIFFVTDISNNPTAIETRNEFSLSSFEKIILYLLFIFSNLLFLIFWGVLFVVEARRFMRIKYPKMYHLLCLCNNEVAVKKEKKVREDFLRGDELIDIYLDLNDDIHKARSHIKTEAERLDDQSIIMQDYIEIKSLFEAIKKNQRTIKQMKHKNTLKPAKSAQNKLHMYLQNDLVPDFDIEGVPKTQNDEYKNDRSHRDLFEDDRSHSGIYQKSSNDLLHNRSQSFLLEEEKSAHGKSIAFICIGHTRSQNLFMEDEEEEDEDN